METNKIGESCHPADTGPIPPDLVGKKNKVAPKAIPPIKLKSETTPIVKSTHP
jgi:hypothetical protein